MSEKEWNEVELELPAVGLGGKVVLNGIEMQDVRGVSVNSHLDGPTEVTITLIAHVNYTPKP